MATQMNNTKPKRSVRPTYLVIVLNIVLLVGSLSFSWYSARSQAKVDMPSPIVHVFIKDLRDFNAKNGRFPISLGELQQKVWEKQGYSSVPLSEKERSMVHSNYYYLYTQSGPYACTVWAAPIGPQRQESSTYFLTITRDNIVSWKGAPLELEDFKRIHGLMRDAELMELGLLRQQPGGQSSGGSLIGKLFGR